MINFEVRGIADVKRLLSTVNRQVAFAASKALNKTAEAVQNHEVTRELPDHLKLRGQWFKPRTKYGINIRFARRNNLVAVVGSQADWLRLVDVGGTKTPPKTALAIPTTNIDTSRPRRKADKPGRLISSGKAFVAVTKSGNAGVFMRVGKERYPIKPLYFFRKSAQVKDILDFFESGKVVADQVYLNYFSTELAKAIATAR